MALMALRSFRALRALMALGALSALLSSLLDSSGLLKALLRPSIRHYKAL